MLRVALAIIAVTAVVLAGCGGDDEEPAGTPTGGNTPAATPTAEDTPAATPTAEDTPAATPTPEDTPAATPTPEDTAAEGAEIFTSSCATCHTLAAAGADGKVGPNLDQLEPDETRVENKVRKGGGGMPAFEGDLTDDEITAVSQYVATSAGG